MRSKKNQNAQNINRNGQDDSQEVIPRWFNEPGSSDLPGEYWEVPAEHLQNGGQSTKMCQFSQRSRKGRKRWRSDPRVRQKDPLRIRETSGGTTTLLSPNLYNCIYIYIIHIIASFKFKYFVILYAPKIEHQF